MAYSRSGCVTENDRPAGPAQQRQPPAAHRITEGVPASSILTNKQRNVADIVPSYHTLCNNLPYCCWHQVFRVAHVALDKGRSQHLLLRPFAWQTQQHINSHSLFLPLQRGAGPMALMLWLDWVT
jgi:hypothetical protein